MKYKIHVTQAAERDMAHANRAYRAVSLRQKQLDHHSENGCSKRKFAGVLITEYFIWALTFVGAFSIGGKHDL